ncbi:MAG TPA: adenylate kinase [Nitrososphaerales archaeon]|nr:adenylate kinase [Nitrososphaerales archaeon]HUK74417.1 adenylate kinase [Nitrososphaerales archaeon]
MGLRIVIVGVPGVGKSTVVEKAKAAVKGSTVEVFGTAMFQEAMRLKWVKHRDEMRKLPVEKQQKLQAAAAARMSRGKGKVVFIDTHLFIRTPEGFWPGLPLRVIQPMKPTHLILVEASPGEILSRRKNDTTRYRDEITEDQVSEELALARSFLTTASLVSGAPMLFVKNGEGRSDEAAEKIAALVRGAKA